MLSKRPELTSFIAGGCLSLSSNLIFDNIYSVAVMFFSWFALVTLTATSEVKALIFVIGGVNISICFHLYSNTESLVTAIVAILFTNFVSLSSTHFLSK